MNKRPIDYRRQTDIQHQNAMSVPATTTTEDKCVGIIPGFSWKFQRKVFHTLAESICNDIGTPIEDFKRLGHIIIDENDEFVMERKFQLKNLCESFLDESYYMSCSIACFLQRDRHDHPLAKSYPLIYEKITQNGRYDWYDDWDWDWNDDWEKVFLPFAEHAAEKLEEIKQKQKEPPPTESTNPSSPSPEDWVFVKPKKRKNKKKNKQRMPPLTSDEIIAKYRALVNPHNEAISTLCTYLLTELDKRYSEYRKNKANMNIFLLGVHDKSGNPINIINPTHSFAIIRKNIGEFTGVV
mgnify:CR=1 FL=1